MKLTDPSFGKKYHTGYASILNCIFQDVLARNLFNERRLILTALVSPAPSSTREAHAILNKWSALQDRAEKKSHYSTKRAPGRQQCLGTRLRDLPYAHNGGYKQVSLKHEGNMFNRKRRLCPKTASRHTDLGTKHETVSSDEHAMLLQQQQPVSAMKADVTNRGKKRKVKTPSTALYALEDLLTCGHCHSVRQQCALESCASSALGAAVESVLQRLRCLPDLDNVLRMHFQYEVQPPVRK
eukprot:2692679-Amphidinium_carterae.1